MSKIPKWFRGYAALTLLALAHSSFAQPATTRTLVFISDTHMGVGKVAGGQWVPSEDFRWSNALAGFLDHLDSKYGSHVDLVVLGDFLELWQPYAGMKCSAPKEETSCTVTETAGLADYVAKAHAGDLQKLGAFSRRGSNRLYLVSGNHDAALNLDEVWEKVRPAFGTEARVELIKSGVWVSATGLTVAEHGHQIGKDVNKFERWPMVENPDYPNHLARPWGQLFVQSIFNEVEDQYPIIDNISPESVGAKYRIADQGGLVAARDIAKLLMFNLFETSRSQLAAVLSASDHTPVKWQPELGKKAGYALVVDSLPPGDDFANVILSESDAGEALRSQLDEQVRELPDEGVRQLCDLAAMSKKYPCLPATASSLSESLLRSERAVLAPHLQARQAKNRNMINFIYGHTHEYQSPWTAKVNGSNVNVSNTGAFQRVIDEVGFERRRTDKSLSKSESLKKIALADLPACYTFVVIENEARGMALFRWYQPEDVAIGLRLEEGDDRCR